jgi:hypothetical protein
MNLDRRFAIVIGINDYEIKPLDYSVNDAKEIANTLENKCCYDKKDIYLITSDKDNPTKDISGHLENALKLIAKELVPRQDSVFFYFAGHGEYHFENSDLLFHDSLTEIKDIYTRINALEPKYQCYVIDACESGGKVISRGNDDKSDLIEKYISKSTGILFMYAATETEKANESSLIKHGLFTYYFLNAIKDEKNYDDAGVLTPNRIMDYIARETSKETKFKQTPVIENRTAGYYPFAFKVPPTKEQPELFTTTQNDIQGKAGIVTAEEKVYFPQIPPEIRKQLFYELKARFQDSKNDWLSVFNRDDYEVIEGKDAGIYDYDTESKLTDSIVEKSEKEGVYGFNRVFFSERRENTPTPFAGAMSILDAFKPKTPTYSVYSNIDWTSDDSISLTLYFKSKNIYKVSFGVVVIVYQATYGVGVARSTHYYDNTGYADRQMRGLSTSIEAYKIHGQTIENILNSISSFFNSMETKIQKWNTERVNSINTFDKKSK